MSAARSAQTCPWAGTALAVDVGLLWAYVTPVTTWAEETSSSGPEPPGPPASSPFSE